MARQLGKSGVSKRFDAVAFWKSYGAPEIQFPVRSDARQPKKAQVRERLPAMSGCVWQGFWNETYR